MTDIKVWEGIWNSFAEAPAIGPGFDGDIWRERTSAAMADSLAALRAGKPLPAAAKPRDYLLPAVAGALLSGCERLRMVDFGGGIGAAWVSLAAAIPEAAQRILMHVVEVENVCDAGRQLFGDGPGPAFHSACPPLDEIDLVHCGSALQYIEDWRGIIDVFAGYRAKTLLLSDVFAGPFAPYVTLQNYYGSRIPHWFLNRDEVVAAVCAHGYRLILDTPHHARILGRDGVLPMEHFPEGYRLDHARHFLFGRIDA